MAIATLYGIIHVCYKVQGDRNTVALVLPYNYGRWLLMVDGASERFQNRSLRAFLESCPRVARLGQVEPREIHDGNGAERANAPRDTARGSGVLRARAALSRDTEGPVKGSLEGHAAVVFRWHEHTWGEKGSSRVLTHGSVWTWTSPAPVIELDIETRLARGRVRFRCGHVDQVSPRQVSAVLPKLVMYRVRNAPFESALGWPKRTPRSGSGDRVGRARTGVVLDCVGDDAIFHHVRALESQHCAGDEIVFAPIACPNHILGPARA